MITNVEAANWQLITLLSRQTAKCSVSSVCPLVVVLSDCTSRAVVQPSLHSALQKHELQLLMLVAMAHPWPYLSKFFEFLEVSGNTYRFKCLLCAPKITECAAYHNSPSNLKKHVD